MKFYPIEKAGGGGAEKVVAMLKEGQNKFWGSFLQVLAILKGWGGGGGGGHNSFHSLKGGLRQLLPCFQGGSTNIFGPAIFPFCSPPPPFPY